MLFFKYFTPITYWLLVLMWSFIFLFYARRLRSQTIKSQLLFTLIVILAIDAFRTLFESIYFGAWYTSLEGFLPPSVYLFLVRPEIVFIPKLLNIIAAVVVIGLLIYRWIPEEEREKDLMEKLVKERTDDLAKSNALLKQEIIERRQITESLKQSEARFKKMIEKSPLPMVITDQNKDIALFNDKFTELFGYTLEDVSTAEEWWKRSYPDKEYRDKVQQSWLTAIDNAKANNTDIEMQEWDLTIKDNSKRSCEFYMVPLDDFSLIIMNDITERKGIENDLKRQALAMDNSSETIVVTDTLGNINYVNPAFEKVTGYSGKEVHGKNLSILKSEVHNSLFYEELWKTLSNGETWAGHFINKRKDGSQYTEEATISPVFSDKNEIVNYVAVKRDISERLKLEDRLRQAQKMESIGTLAGGIAHDFNNILSSIIGFVELALDDVAKGTSLEDNLQEVYTAGKRARDLVKQILAFSRQSDEERKQLQVDAIAKEVLKLIRSSIPTTIEIRENIESHSMIMGNPSQVHQLLMNLCTNAAQAMDDSGGILEVGLTDIEHNDLSPVPVSGLEFGSYINMTISDTGSGISPDILGSIFEPYFTTKGVGEGTGLGLALAHGIVESYGGKIVAESKLGKGTVFSIYLPITKKHEDHRPYEKEKLHSGTERILFVDDELSIAKMGSQMLKRLGYRVTVLTSSVEALRLFRSKPDDFDLVISDVTMPDMTGSELAKELIACRFDIPIILCTGYSKKMTDEKAANIGVKALAHKPIVKADLAKTVRTVLDDAGRTRV